MSTEIATTRPLIIIAGVGNGRGTGGAIARLFAKQGYRVALLSRPSEELKKEAEFIVSEIEGSEVVVFPVHSYSYAEIRKTVQDIKKYQWPTTPEASQIRVAVWNAAHPIVKAFLEITEQDLRESLNVNLRGAFAFAHEVIGAFRTNEVDAQGRRGTLLFTGSTSSVKGHPHTAAYSAAKGGLRSLSQTLNKEFGKENIHVCHTIIDGPVLNDATISKLGEWQELDFIDNKDIRLDPESIAASYLFLTNQDRTAWTWELDLRPAHEQW